MNYLKQIVAFDKWEELHPLSDKAYRLWFKLMAIANTSGWDEWLSVPLLKLKSELHTSSDQTVMNARNALAQAGRIEVRKGKHGKSADYRLIPFSEVTSGVKSGEDSGVINGGLHGVKSGEDSGVINGGLHGVKSGEDSGVINGGLHGVKSGEDSGAYYKQNKTKQNNKVLIDAHANDTSKVFNLWESNWGFPNGIAQQDLTKWIDKFGVDLVIHAIEFALRRNINAKGADRYLAKTFDHYEKQSIKTVEQAERDEQLHQQQMSREYHQSSSTRRVVKEHKPGWMIREERMKQRVPAAGDDYVIPDDSMDPMPK